MAESQPVEGDVTKYRDRWRTSAPTADPTKDAHFKTDGEIFSTQAGPTAAGHCVMGQAVGRAADKHRHDQKRRPNGRHGSGVRLP